MKCQRALCLLLPFTFTTACIENSGDPPSDDEVLSETESDLSTANWGVTGSYANSLYGAQAATVNGTTYMVHTGFTNKNMYWRKRTAANAWSAPVLIPGQRTSDQVSLAAFNGYLYMVHVGETDASAVWFSRFDPITETWTPNIKLALQANTGAPALAAFDGRLWIVGATEVFGGTYQLWVSTMNTNESFTPQTSLMRKYTSSRVSLAVFANKLFMAYGSGSSIMTMTHASGALATTWSSPSAVKSGPSGTTAQGWGPSLAVAGGYLHLVYQQNVLSTFWTYWNQCSWAPETWFDSVQSNHAPSLTNGGPGLVLVRDAYWSIVGGGESYHVLGTEYSAPPPPMTVPQCGGVLGT